MGNNKLLIIAFGLIIAVVLLLAVLVLRRGLGGGEELQQARLEFWGVFDDGKDFRDVLDAFQIQHPNIRVNYRKFNFEEYEKQLIDAFAAGRGPDIWMMHHTWLSKHKDKISPLPQAIKDRKEPLMTLRDFKNQFVDVAEKDLVSDGQIYGLPIYVDTLGLYYNKEILNSAGISSPPSSWEDLNDAVEAITKIDDQNRISQSAIAMGTAKNINRSTDILALLMLQSGLPLVENAESGARFSKIVDQKNVGEVALEYYTDFANPLSRNYTWNDQMDFSIDAFRTGKTAMMINYSHHAGTLRSQASRFNFDVAPVPQIKGAGVVNYANYFAPTVSKFSKSPIQAWEFLIFLSSREGAAKYLNASNRPPARRDLVDALRNDVNIGVFAVQALSARSWYQADNQAVEKIFADMIDDINFNKRSIKEALRFAENQVNTLLFKERQ